MCLVFIHRPSNTLLPPLKDFQSEALFDFKVFEQIMETIDKIFDEIRRDVHVEKHEELQLVFFEQEDSF